MAMAFPARSARHGLLDSGRHSRVMVWIMAIMVFLTVLAAGSGLAIGAFGCQGTNTTSTMVPKSNVDTIHRITNQGLSEKVHFEAANLDMDGPAHLAQVTMRNTSNDPKTFAYLVEWFGSNQIVLGQGEQTWRTTTIQPVPMHCATISFIFFYPLPHTT